MKQKDNLEQLFERLEGTFDIHETPANHKNRFLEKLEQYDTNKAKNTNKFLNWWKPLSIAASIVLLVTLGIGYNTQEDENKGLASVSAEMEQTESFFVTTINQELELLKSFENADTKILVEETIIRLGTLEKEYDELKLDLVQSGNDKRVISGMITNFQNRIEILQQVIETIEEIKTLKANKNENIL